MGEYIRKTYRIDDIHYPLVQYSYDGSNNIEYIGYNTNIDAADADTSWKITKFSYTSGDIVKKETREQEKRGGGTG